ncbi:MAG: DNA polymerase III subunit epsilon [Pseudomonadales bacterium]|nr:DNA polymerase III subunit epsilon [Pseudomonadales bacterium]
MRQIVLDTETTGLEAAKGHRVIEIGAVELIDRRFTGKQLHHYFNPEREIDDGAFEVHGLSSEFLADKPLFAEVADELLAFLTGAELIIHNAPFDLAFLDAELARLGGRRPRLHRLCRITDSLALARRKHPGQKNSLDALCRRYGVDNSARTLHGALLDAEILADVYLALTGGQTALFGAESDQERKDRGEPAAAAPRVDGSALKVVEACPEDIQAHEAWLDLLDEKCDAGSAWRLIRQTADSSRNTSR